MKKNLHVRIFTELDNFFPLKDIKLNVIRNRYFKQKKKKKIGKSSSLRNIKHRSQNRYNLFLIEYEQHILNIILFFNHIFLFLFVHLSVSLVEI